MDCKEFLGYRVCGYPYLDCRGGPETGRPSGFARLDFGLATLSYSNLGGLGPDVDAPRAVRYDDVGTAADGTPFDLLITNRSAYEYNNNILNGLKGPFGQLNVFIGTSVDLTFAFVTSGTDERLVLDSLMISFYDFDEGVNSVEVLTVERFDTYTLAPDTEIDVSDNSFAGSTRGVGADNPQDPVLLTDQQKRRSVAFTLSKISSIDLTFAVVGTGNGGRNFQFAGESFQLPDCPYPPAPPPPPSPPPPSPPSPPPAPPCRAEGDSTDSFSFDNAYIKHSNLAGFGPDEGVPESMRIGGVGTTAEGVEYDMEVRRRIIPPVSCPRRRLR